MRLGILKEDGRSKVPKCLECDCHTFETVNGMTIEGLGKRHHWCGRVKLQQGTLSKSVEAKDVKTSPKYCPMKINNQ